MADYQNQHYVPRFLLRGFSENKRAVRLFNIDRQLFVDSASIASQCSKTNFYSEVTDLELALKNLDTAAATIIHEICDTETIPDFGSGERELLTLFYVLQIFRTQSAANDVNTHHDRLAKYVFGERLKKDLGLTDDELNGVQIGIQSAPSKAIAMAAESHFLALDLDIKLIINNTEQEFITSDHPAILYNQYLEHRTFSSNTGIQSQGLEVFLPISSQRMLLMYDPSTYRIGTRKQVHCVPINNLGDIAAINKATYINAVDNIYFKSASMRAIVAELHGKHAELRKRDRVDFEVVERRKTKNGYSETIRFGGNDLRIGLRPSVVDIRKSARKKLREIEKQKFQPAVLLRDKFMVKKFREFHEHVKAGKYKPSDFPRYLMETIKNGPKI